MNEGQQTRQAADAECKTCAVRSDGMYAPPCQERLVVSGANRTPSRMIRAGTDLFAQGEECRDVYTLNRGWAFTYVILEDGRRQILSFELPGSLLGLMPEDSGPMAYGCQALTDMAVCVIPRTNLLRVARQQPDLGLRLAALAARDQLLLQDHLTSVGRRSAYERIANLLLELFCRVRHAVPAATGETIELPLTQTHIGDAMGLTSIHVSRTLKVLREAGVLNLKDRTLRILDPEGLAEAAGFDRDMAARWSAGARPAAQRRAGPPAASAIRPVARPVTLNASTGPALPVNGGALRPFARASAVTA